MYAIYGNIDHQYTPNVSIYTIHGSYGIDYYYALTFLQLLYHILLLLILVFKTKKTYLYSSKCHLRLYLGVVLGFEHILRGCWDHQGLFMNQGSAAIPTM